MKLSDIVRDAGGETMSHTKLWNNVASATATGVIIWFAWKGTLSDDMLLWYLAILGGGAAISKGVAFKYGKGESK